MIFSMRNMGIDQGLGLHCSIHCQEDNKWIMTVYCISQNMLYQKQKHIVHLELAYRLFITDFNSFNQSMKAMTISLFFFWKFSHDPTSILPSRAGTYHSIIFDYTANCLCLRCSIRSAYSS